MLFSVLNSLIYSGLEHFSTVFTGLAYCSCQLKYSGNIATVGSTITTCSLTSHTIPTTQINHSWQHHYIYCGHVIALVIQNGYRSSLATKVLSGVGSWSQTPQLPLCVCYQSSVSIFLTLWWVYLHGVSYHTVHCNLLFWDSSISDCVHMYIYSNSTCTCSMIQEV